ncbi:MAG: TIGR00730 family Rossman fold protein [Myxococcota bacterium]
MKRSFARICVYCGSSNQVDPRWFEVARSVGERLVSRGLAVVYGGGSVGLMGAVADAALAGGGEVYGVIPQKLFDLELGHPGLTELHVVETMHQRKQRMAELADAFIALPGGWGTLEEIFEVTTWTQLQYHDKPVGLLNAHGFYDGLIAFLDHVRDQRFIRLAHRRILADASELDLLLERLATVELPEVAGSDLART